MSPVPKIEILRRHMNAGNWQKAISIASKFPRLGQIRGAVLDAHMAFTNQSFVLQLRKDPETLIAAGRTALVETYLKKPNITAQHSK